MKTNTTVSPDYLLSRILMYCCDEGLNNGFTKGHYEMLIYNALEELAFDTKFPVLTDDIINWYKPGTESAVDLPDGNFSMEEVYVYNGSSFVIENSCRVYWKKRFNTSNKRQGYTARRKSDHNHFHGQGYSGSGYTTGLWGNIQNGRLMLSDGCQSFDNLRLVYNGIQGCLGETPFVPIFLQEAVIDWVSESILRVRKLKEPSMRVH